MLKFGVIVYFTKHILTSHKKLWLFHILLFLFINIANSQEDNLSFKRYTIDDGLSQSRVYDINLKIPWVC